MNEYQELFEQVGETVRRLDSRIGRGVETGIYVNRIDDALGDAEYYSSEDVLPLMLEYRDRAEFALKGINVLIKRLEESKIDN